jgi:hypothetical protein
MTRATRRHTRRAACMGAACAVLGLAIAAHAQPHATDIVLKVENGAIVTGGVVSGGAVFPRQVFTSVLGVYGIPGATFDPGFDSETGAFPPSTPVGITIRRALRKWDGQDFSSIPPERFEIIRSQTVVTPEFDPPDCGVGDDLQLGLTTSTGRLHQHPAYQLTAPASPGIYMVELEAWFAAPGSGVSEPFFVLFSHDESLAVLEAAFEWVDQNLARTCYANCDRSTTAPVLNVEDFTCFINRFAHGDCYANCDRSTTPPVLNVEDFTCFLSRFAQGCP